MNPRRGIGRLTACDIAAGVLCAAILAHALSVTSDVSWPADADQFRDLSQARTMLDGSWLGDPYYRGETTWYNPFTGAFIALLSALTGAPPHIVHVKAGPFVNLLAPVAFYVFMAMAVSRSAALLGLVAFVCFDHSLAYIAASYSPWIFPSTIAQGLFFLSLVLLARPLLDRDGPHPVLAGILLGIVFLTHLAPAAVLGGVLAASWFRDRGRRDVPRAVGQLALTGAVAAIVASPLLWSIVVRYRLDVANPYPSIWQEEMLELGRFPQFARDHFGQWMMFVAAAGLIFVLRQRHDRGPRMIASWTVTAVAALAYSYLWQWMNTRGIDAPAVLPGFHFFRYVKLAELALFGCGAAWIVAGALRLIRQWADESQLRRAQHIASIAVSVIIVVWSLPSYLTRPDATSIREQSLSTFTGDDQRALYDWIDSQPERQAIYAAPNDVSHSIIGPAGGRVLVTYAAFSNPFVDWQTRDMARTQLIRALADHDCDAARALARRFDVTFVVADRHAIAADAPCDARPVFAGRVWRIFRVSQ